MSAELQVQQPRTPSAFAMLRTLGGIAMLSGLLVVLIYEYTLPIIAENQRIATERAVFRVIPGAIRKRDFMVTPIGLVPAAGATDEGDRIYAAYDADGKLLSIQVRLARQENPALGPQGYTNSNTVYWDPKVDLIYYSLHDAHRLVEWTDGEKAVMFSPDFMRRRWLKYRQPSQALVDSAEQFYLRPSLEAGKFPEERDTSLPADLEERIRAQNAAGHLVFSEASEE